MSQEGSGLTARARGSQGLLVPKQYAKVNARLPTKVTDDKELGSIPCPYEPLGKAIVEFVVERRNGVVIRRHIDMNGTYRCDNCRKWFKLTVKTLLQGVPLELQPGEEVALSHDTTDPTFEHPPKNSGWNGWYDSLTKPSRNRDGTEL